LDQAAEGLARFVFPLRCFNHAVRGGGGGHQPFTEFVNGLMVGGVDL
jgi:hypothetical protein